MRSAARDRVEMVDRLVGRGERHAAVGARVRVAEQCLDDLRRQRVVVEHGEACGAARVHVFARGLGGVAADLRDSAIAVAAAGAPAAAPAPVNHEHLGRLRCVAAEACGEARGGDLGGAVPASRRAAGFAPPSARTARPFGISHRALARGARDDAVGELLPPLGRRHAIVHARRETSASDCRMPRLYSMETSR